MNDHYIVTLNRGHLRIYAETRASGQIVSRLEVVEAMDFPGGRRSFTENARDVAGRFPHAKSGSGGMSVDERLPMKREEERRKVRVVAAELDAFLGSRPRASWDVAAAPALFHALVDALSAATRRRLKRVLSKDLANQRAEEVGAHFATAGR